MRKSITILICATCMVANMLLACGNKTQASTSGDSTAINSDSISTDTIALETECASYENKYANVSVSLTLPVGEGVAQTIRQSLLTLIGTQIYKDADYSGEGNVKGKPYSDDTKNLKAICSFYCKGIFKCLEKENKSEYELIAQDIENDTTMTEEQRKVWSDEFPTYVQEIRLTEVCESDNFIVFDDITYGERGGAHGGVGGYGYIIFNKTTGKQVKKILKNGVAKKMQGLLKNGLKQYFKECNEPIHSDEELMENLMLPDGSTIIPLPQNNGIVPTDEGLDFVYSQYEITCYAAGMPSFTIPYKYVKEFMTEEALSLLKK